MSILYDEVYALVESEFGIPVSEDEYGVTLAELGIDSVGLLEFGLVLEMRYGCRPIQMSADMTVRDVVLHLSDLDND